MPENSCAPLSSLIPNNVNKDNPRQAKVETVQGEPKLKLYYQPYFKATSMGITKGYLSEYTKSL